MKSSRRIGLRAFLVLSSSSTVFGAVSNYMWPSPQFDAIERFLYEGTNVFGSAISALADNCQKRQGPPSSTVAAEWLRMTYHDVATHNISDGTGGLDASIFFELDRAENIGAGNKNSVGDFRNAASKYVSRSDLIAMAAVWGVAACGGPQVAYRYGRQDAMAAGRLGVPLPQDDLASHTEAFRLQGFTPAEMIGLVACGHTLGGVRAVDFPNIVVDPANATIATFDTTPAFDSSIVSEYLDSSTKDPLIRATNTNLTSDQRIFGSDNNATMNALNSAGAYFSTCSTLLARMIDTVPSSVQLSSEVNVLPAKVYSAQITVMLDSDSTKQLAFTSTLRLTQNNTTIPPNRQVKLLWCDRQGDFKDCNKITNVATSPPELISSAQLSPLSRSLKLKFPTYAFQVPLSANRSVSKFWFEVDEGDGSPATTYDNGGAGYLLDDALIFAPYLSQLTFPGNQMKSQNLVVGKRLRGEPIIGVYSCSRLLRIGPDTGA
ncbi:hypothetical protein GALMADRAFT_880845 [Galerina marginata CBS 339.88]|uniref:Peroxidase n=1 Tax=Galerina marginata (strain CBS 339.88) TaxID=685588 RepID=A0A067SID5_GALM3|nr:hypothetical protein GALMADRAFT_880845 [Galerina marginata CBS 339.88]